MTVGQNEEDLLAAVLWRFIEQIRAQERLGGNVALIPAPAREMLGLLTLAAHVGDALSEAETAPSAHLHARHRLESAILEKPPRSPAPGTREGSRLRDMSPTQPPLRTPTPAQPPLQHSRWTWAALGATAAVVAGLLGIDIGRRLPAPDPLTHPPASMLVLSHQRVQQWLPRLLKNQLSPREARAMWWHLAHCDDCFHAYQQMSRPAPRRVIGRTERAERRGLLAFGDLPVGGPPVTFPPTR